MENLTSTFQVHWIEWPIESIHHTSQMKHHLVGRLLNLTQYSLHNGWHAIPCPSKEVATEFYILNELAQIEFLPQTQLLVL